MRARSTDPSRPLSACRRLGAGLLLSGLSLLGACSADSADVTAAAEDELSSQLKDTIADPERKRDVDACVEGSLLTRACVDPGIWRAAVTRACAAFGATVRRAAPVEACDGGFHGVKFLCCPEAPPPPPPPNQCRSTVLGDDTSCKPEATWKEYASRLCNDQMLRLGDLSFDGRCGDGQYSHAKVTCCRPEAPPPPPPNACVDQLLGGDSSCKPDATWKEYAVRACADKGLRLESLALDGSCGEAQYRLAKLRCCPDAPPPPPPMCVTADQGDVTSCKSEATWKEYAAKDCQARGLTLRELAFADRCGEGQYRHAKYACCK